MLDFIYFKNTFDIDMQNIYSFYYIHICIKCIFKTYRIKHKTTILYISISSVFLRDIKSSTKAHNNHDDIVGFVRYIKRRFSQIMSHYYLNGDDLSL